MPTLLQINVTANLGSTGRIAEEIGQVAISEGWKSYIAYGRADNNSSSQLFRIGTKKDVYFHVLSTRLFDRHGLSSEKATITLIEYIAKIRPNIIHLHNIHGYYLNYPILFNYLSQSEIPIVWTLHDCWPFTGHCAYYDYAECNRWKSGCYDCPQKKEYPATLFYDRSAKNYTDKKHWFTSVKNMTLVPVSEWLATEVKKSFLGQYPIKVIHNGIDTDIFKPQLKNEKSLKFGEKFVILGVASVWAQRKGFTDFIKLRQLLSDEYAIILIGLNKKQITSLPEGIIGISRTSNVQELAEYYSMADVYINTSVEETLGMTSIESLSCGTPAIVYNATACPETISSGCGVIVEKGDIQGIANKVLEIHKNKKMFDAQLCRKRVLDFFDKKDRYMEYLSLYRELLSQK